MNEQKFTSFLKYGCAFAAVLTLFLVGLGGYVRATGAGLSCPDWPLCFGRAIPEDFGRGVFQEVFHRYVASIISLFTIVFWFFARKFRSQFPKAFTLANVLLIILVIQVILGGLTVLMKLNPFIVTSHLLAGTLFLQILSLIAYFSFRQVSLKGRNAFIEKFSLFFAFVVFLQIIIGGFVGSSGASLACFELPYCHGMEFGFPDSGPQQLHMIHRFMAVGISLVAVVGMIIAFSIRQARIIYTSVALLVIAQIVLGLFNVLKHVPVDIAVAHLVVAQLILFLLLLEGSRSRFAGVSSV